MGERPGQRKVALTNSRPYLYSTRQLGTYTPPECQFPSNDFLPRLLAYLPSLPTELAGSLPRPPRGQELPKSRDYV